jgi:hypothetical protein
MSTNQLKNYLMRNNKGLFLLSAACASIMILELFVFNKEYLLGKAFNLKEQRYSINDGSLYQFNMENGKLIAQTNDPNITFDNLNTSVRDISINCDNSIPGATGQVFFRNIDESFSETRSVQYDASSGKKIISLGRTFLSFSMVQKVASLRFDLTNIPADSIRCSEIVINPHIPVNFSRGRLAIYIIGSLLFAAIIAFQIIELRDLFTAALISGGLVLAMVVASSGFLIRPENYLVLFLIIAVLIILLSKDKEFLALIKLDFIEFIKDNKWYWVATAITAILSYGFTLTNYSVGVDDSEIPKYVQGDILAQGRFSGGQILRLIFDPYEFLPFWADALGMFVLIGSIIVWSMYFVRMSCGRMDKKYTIIFSCIVISFPVGAYLYIFSGALYNVGCAFLFVGVALILFWGSFQDSESISSPLINFHKSSLSKISAAIIFLAISIGLVEWSAPLFLIGVFSGMLLYYGSNDATSVKLSSKIFLITIVKITIVLVLALILKELLTNLYQKLNHISPSGYLSNYMIWNRSTVIQDIPRFIASLLTVFFGDLYEGQKTSFWLMAVSYGILADTFIAIYLSIKRKSGIPALIVFCFVISVFSLNIVTGNTILEMRTYVYLAMPTAFALMFATFLICEDNFTRLSSPGTITLHMTSGLKIAVVSFIVLIVLLQTKEINRLLYWEYLRYEADVRTAYNIIDEIEKQDGSIKKPVVFIGPFRTSANIRMGYSVFEHDRWNLPERMVYPDRIISFMRQLGYNVRAVSSQNELDKALYEAKNMQSYPKEGSIRAFKDFIVVKFGSLSSP